MQRDKNDSLAHWLAIWHPNYRMILAQLFLAGVIASALIYGQNYFLSLLTPLLSGDTSQIPKFVSALAPPDSPSAPLIVVLLFALTAAAATGIGYWKAWTTGRMRIASKNDLENEVLQHLLHKDDSFLGKLSPAETVNRLSVDLTRVGMRRKAYMEIWWMSLLLAGYLLFFFARDWRLALVAVLVMGLGAAWTVLMSGRIKRYDSVYLRQDDAVKSRFEDCLKAASEIQVSRLFSRAGRRLTSAQEGRTGTFMRFVKLHGLLDLGKTLAPVLAFMAMFAVVLHLRSGGQDAEALALVPVILWALPALFFNASEIVLYQLDMQLAKTSEKRLLEYESPEKGTRADAADGAPPESVPLAGLRLESVSYRYPAEGGGFQGGVENIDALFEPGQWTAIVGGAGSGKSTVFKLITGRLKPQAGRILYGEGPLDELGEETLAGLFSLMPQSPALFDDTIGNNLFFARGGQAPGEPDAEALRIIEEIGLGSVCRQKALEMTPAPGPALAEVERDIARLRQNMREAVEAECGVEVVPFESGRLNPRDWVLEGILGGRSEPDKVLEALDGRGRKLMKSLAATEDADRLCSLARALLKAGRSLLEPDKYQAYRDLAPYPAPEKVWALRRSLLGLLGREPANAAETADLCLVALTSRPAEVAGEIDAEFWTAPGLGGRLPHARSFLRKIAGEHCREFSAAAIHPLLGWRDNLLFGSVPEAREGVRQKIDGVLIEKLSEAGLGDFLASQSMNYRVGQRGSGLSGGQGQITALGRSLLRGSPVLLLDEPTSALDPAGRSRLCDFFKKFRGRSTLITISHDPEFIRHADSILVLEQGRLAGQGTYSELAANNEVFRKTMRLI